MPTVGWVIWPVKIVSTMTYNVFGGTLNPTLLLINTPSCVCRSAVVSTMDWELMDLGQCGTIIAPFVLILFCGNFCVQFLRIHKRLELHRMAFLLFGRILNTCQNIRPEPDACRWCLCWFIKVIATACFVFWNELHRCLVILCLHEL